jgi:hypothetical protein
MARHRSLTSQPHLAARRARSPCGKRKEFVGAGALELAMCPVPGILSSTMETPEHERRAVEDYLYSESGDNFEVEHVEKLTSEYVLGRQYDVWDAHTNEGRWWVITNPTNLYSQELIKSMDVALSFHVGLMSRMMARRPAPRSRDVWILDVLRRMDVGYASLDRAQEVEDFQAVGMRLRETLLTLGERLAGPVVEVGPAAEPKRGDFKAWADLTAGRIAAGSEAKYLRGLLKATSEITWAYVNWLTHARRATELDARLACGMTSQVIEAFITAVTRWRLGAPERCPACGSYQLALDYIDDEWAKLCSACGRMEPAEAPHSVQEPLDEPKPSVPVGDACAEVEDFGIYLSPQQSKAMVDAVSERLEAEQTSWGNPFTVINEDGLLADAHRLALRTVREPRPGSELVYDCGNDACVNPAHGREEELPKDPGWTLGIVEEVVPHWAYLELKVSAPGAAMQRFYVGRDLLDRYGLADASSLLERIVCQSPADEQGLLRVVVAERRGDYGNPSVAPGWLHPPDDVD